MKANTATERRIDTGQLPSEVVVLGVADHLGTDPRELTPPLARVIDPDCLDKIALETPSVLIFRYNGCEIRVRDGTLVEIESV